MPNCFARQRAQRDVHTETSCSECRFHSCVACADDDDIETIAHGNPILFSDTESREDVREQIFRRTTSGYFFQRVSRVLQIGQNEFL